MIAMNQTREKNFIILYQLECDTCFSFLITNIFELRKNHLNDDSFFIIKCPSCEYETYVSKEMLEKSSFPIKLHKHL